MTQTTTTTTTTAFILDQQEHNIKIFLAKFPNNATSWAQATDEIRDLARTAKELYNELDADDTDDSTRIQALDFRSFKTPAQWNSEGKKYIMQVLTKMSTPVKEYFYNYFAHWFNNEK